MKRSTPNGRRWLSAVGKGIVAGATVSMLGVSPALAKPDPGGGSGADLSSWEVTVGDGVFAAEGETPVGMDDVAVENLGDQSRLTANVAQRGVMAHVLAYKRITDVSMMSTVHRAGFSFQLPYVPSTAGGSKNAQTVDGGLHVWDGAGTRLDQGVAFQWVLNPWLPNFGQIMVWSDADGGSWVSSGFLQPDTAWHTAEFRVNPVQGVARLLIDGVLFEAPYSHTPKPGWGTDVSARLQVEAISVWPGSTATWAPEHEVLFKNWFWKQRLVKTPGQQAAKRDKVKAKVETANERATQAQKRAAKAVEAALKAMAKAEQRAERAEQRAEQRAERAEQRAEQRAERGTA